MTVDRRQFAQAVGAIIGCAFAGAAFASTAMTAADLVERIKAKLLAEGTKWQPSYTDGFKVGDPATIVKGVAVTFEATLDVLQQAVARGFNFIICHEAVFWAGFDAPQILKGDPIRLAKEAFVREHGLVIWRLHDHMHRMQPEPVISSLLHELGWTPYYEKGGRRFDHIEVPEIQLGRLASHMQTKLGTANVVVVGDPGMPVRSVGVGIHILSTLLPVLHKSDVVIVGETSEYDSFEYVRDAVALGQKKGLIRISHERLEEWGVRYFAAWARPLIAPLPFAWLSTGDAFSIQAA